MDDPRYDLDELPCGMDVATLVDATVDGDIAIPEHATSCPTCQAWIKEFRGRWAAVRAEADADIPVPPGVLERVRDWVRHDATLRQSWIVGEYDGGALRVAGRVLLAYIRGAVGRDQDVFALTASADGDTVTVGVAVEYGTAIPVVAEIVRRRAIEEYTRTVGRAPEQVHVHVEDLLESD